MNICWCLGNKEKATLFWEENMSSMVLDLQKEITSQNSDLVSVLRKAKLIAAKLQLEEFSKWIANELNGYKENDKIPEYRLIHGELKAFNPLRGWIPAMIYDAETEKTICEQKVSNSIPELISLCSNGGRELMISFPGSSQKILNQLFDSPIPMQCALHISNAAVNSIIEEVKTMVLDWTIKLENEGILGEGMIFNNDEKENAKQADQTINNFYGSTNVINGSSAPMQVVSGNDNNVSFEYNLFLPAIEEIKDAIEKEKISNEDKETALVLLSEISTKIQTQQELSTIQSLMSDFRGFLVSVGASFTANLISEKIMTLF